MTVFLNGEVVETRGAQSIADLAEHFGLHPNSILIEHNGAALHKREWQQRVVAEGDRIEFIRVVAGG